MDDSKRELFPSATDRGASSFVSMAVDASIDAFTSSKLHILYNINNKMMFKVAASTGTSSCTSSGTSRNNKPLLLSLRWLFLELPLWLVLVAWVSTRCCYNFYTGPLQTLIESFRRSGDVDAGGYYVDFFPDLTYYGRQCTAEDVTTHNSNDLIVSEEDSASDAANTMMTHGAVLIRNLLKNTTATKLRAYLETRHDIKDRLPWHEKFWGDIGRLSLGLGVDDNDIIAQALEEVGSNQVLRTTLEGIVGPDPALVEISTLTTLHGAEMQGIHTDSDFFGSSLLYSRTFLHSYTLFMALQDTTSRMGATTICPGTQWCANEHLEDVCLPDNSFEVSSNGLTGKDVGMLYTGDGMMFNQNVWHRGPRNLDPERPYNRVMFILTFVSRQALEKGDVRQQGLGTYYYQRWNQWGHTFEDLKYASRRLRQPLAALRALGIWKLPGTKWGIVWLEHFARQLANDEDFFAKYELPDFVKFLKNSLGMPKWLIHGRKYQASADAKDVEKSKRGRRRRQDEEDEEDEWEPFLLRLIGNIKDLVDKIHWMALGVYLFAQAILLAMARGRGAGAMVGRTLWKYLVTLSLAWCFYKYVTEFSHLGKRIRMKDTWRQPFSSSATAMVQPLEATTYPTRYDVLVGSRFDAPYLASFNHVLEYHPGNLEFSKALHELHDAGVGGHEWLVTYMKQPIHGVTPRFLQQDAHTGFWSVMDEKVTQRYVARQVYARDFPWVAALDEHLKIVLADARFGLSRETVMAKRFTTRLVLDYQDLLFLPVDEKMEKKPSKNNKILHTTAGASRNRQPSPTKSWWMARPIVDKPLSKISTAARLFKAPSRLLVLNADGSIRLVRSGDKVLAPYMDTDQYWDATIQQRVGNDKVRVSYTVPGELGDSGVVPIAKLSSFQSLVQGQIAELDYSGEGDWRKVEILSIHPLGWASVYYLDDDEDDDIPMDERYEDKVSLDLLRSLNLQVGSLEVEAERVDSIKIQRGDRVRGRFGGQARWFGAVVDSVNADGTYNLLYDDGDFEEEVPAEFVMPQQQK